MSTPSQKEITARVKDTLAAHLEIPLENIKDETAIVDELGVDSFGMVELLFELEDSTGITIPDAEVRDIRTVQDLAKYVYGKLQEGAAATPDAT